MTSVLLTVPEAWQRLMKRARNVPSQLSVDRTSSPGRAQGATRDSTSTWNAETCHGRANRGTSASSHRSGSETTHLRRVACALNTERKRSARRVGLGAIHQRLRRRSRIGRLLAWPCERSINKSSAEGPWGGIDSAQVFSWPPISFVLESCSVLTADTTLFVCPALSLSLSRARVGADTRMMSRGCGR